MGEEKALAWWGKMRANGVNATLQSIVQFAAPAAAGAILSLGSLRSTLWIDIATAAVGKSGQEATLLKMTLKYSVGLLLFVCIWTFILTLIL